MGDSLNSLPNPSRYLYPSQNESQLWRRMDFPNTVSCTHLIYSHPLPDTRNPVILTLTSHFLHKQIIHYDRPKVLPELLPENKRTSPKKMKISKYLLFTPKYYVNLSKTRLSLLIIYIYHHKMSINGIEEEQQST